MTPSREDLDTAIEVLEWFIQDTTENEPHAVNTIATAEETLSGIQAVEAA